MSHDERERFSGRTEGPDGWHVSEALAVRYAGGAAGESGARSVERHVEGCGRCAARVSEAVRRGTAGPGLARVRAALLAEALGTAVGPAPAPGAVAGAGRGGPGARRRAARLLWAAGPAVRGSWLAGLVLVTAAALVLAGVGGIAATGARPLLLALAPVLPVAGVALSYGRHGDPSYEITAATPAGGLRLLLTRAAAVLVVCVPLLTLAGAVLPTTAGAPSAAAWLLPGLTLTAATLALGSFTGCRRAAAALTGLWLTVALVPPLLRRPLDAAEFAGRLSPLAQEPAAWGGWAVAALLCAALVAVRRSSFDRLEHS
ncbi:zf-HC2 domain-containing protein [Streptomyces sp. JNUCC 64]